MWVAFALQNYSHFFSKKFQHICVSLDVNFNESLTNDIVSFEQLGPELLWRFHTHKLNMPFYITDVLVQGVILEMEKSAMEIYWGYIHYENTPIQIYRKFHLQKLKIFR